MKLAMLPRDTRTAQRVEIGEDLRDSAYRSLVARNVNGIRAQIDGDMEPVFEESEVFVASPIERLDPRGNFNLFSCQAFV